MPVTIDVSPVPSSPISVRKIASMAVDGTVSRQWASRPDDQRYLSLADLETAVGARRAMAREAVVPLDHCKIGADDCGEILIATPKGPGANLTHYSFGQLCQRVGAPAGYLRTLPAALAQIPLQWSLEHGEAFDAKFLAHVPQEGPRAVRAITSDTYGRIWDLDVVRAVRAVCDPAIWQVPSSSYSAKDPKRATTLYASDRDVFIFLVDPAHPIQVPGEPDHRMFRGFYVWNSEVGSATFGIATFLYDTVCDNRNIWGVREFTELKIRHTSGGPARFLRDAAPMLAQYAQSSPGDIERQIGASQAKRLGATTKDVREWLKARGFTVAETAKAIDYAETTPGDPKSLWAIEQGLTAAARDLPHADARVDLERRAGKLMDMVA